MTSFVAGNKPISVAIGDFNGDGKSDLAVANLGSNNVSILLGTGTGSFGAATNFPVVSAPVAVAVGDFNSDGKLDLAAANTGSDKVSVLLGTGTGSFGAATNFLVGYHTPDSAVGIAVGDFNADGKLDLAVTVSGPPGRIDPARNGHRQLRRDDQLPGVNRCGLRRGWRLQRRRQARSGSSQQPRDRINRTGDGYR
ncbi:MAG: VCBS repeat-containing protein [Deltaproteobacteria bacterium]|nr:VCBS repeat-containing protein [Deltaproteobacteria bacterium]